MAVVQGRPSTQNAPGPPPTNDGQVPQVSAIASGTWIALGPIRRTKQATSSAPLADIGPGTPMYDVHPHRAGEVVA